MAQCPGSSCKNSPLDSAVVERIEDSLTKILTLDDNFSLSSLSDKQQGTEEYPWIPKAPKVKETDSVECPNIQGHTSGNSSSATVAKGIEKVTKTEIANSKKTSSAVAFCVPVDDLRPIPRCPKRLLASTKQGKEKTLDYLNEKQKLAEKRRKQQRDRKLERIHARQEAARNLAEKVDILLQQRALAMGVGDGNIQPMASSQLIATANQVAHKFRDLTNQLDDDFAVKQGSNTQHKSVSKPKNPTKNNNCPKNENTAQSVCFTVPLVRTSTLSKKPGHFIRQQRKVMTTEDLIEKQRQAEKRRNQRMERRVIRCRESREALLKMAKDIQQFETLQASPSKLGQSKETALLADKIADGFERLRQRYEEDLMRADNFYLEQPYVMRP